MENKGQYNEKAGVSEMANDGCSTTGCLSLDSGESGQFCCTLLIFSIFIICIITHMTSVYRTCSSMEKTKFKTIWKKHTSKKFVVALKN